MSEDSNVAVPSKIESEIPSQAKSISSNESEVNLNVEIDIAKSPNLTSSKSPEKIIPINKVNDEKVTKDIKKEEMSIGKKKLYALLNKQMKIEMTDGRILVGIFLCTDRDANVILGSCTEYLNPIVCGFTSRILGLVMVPGRHIVSIHHHVSDSQLMYMSEDKDSKQI